MPGPLAHAAARGALFTLGAQAARIALQLLSVVILARLLTPHDYGLLAIVLVAVGLGEIFRDFGLTSASIQAPRLSAGQRDNLFWINALIGAVLAALLFALGWPLGELTGLPELVGVAQWLALVFVLNGLATQHRASLMREVRLKPLALVDVLSAAIALAVAVVVASLGGGYWSLVVQQLSGALLSLLGVVVVGRWIPRRYSAAHEVRSMVAFGWHLVAANLVQYVASQVDTVLIAARFGTSPLGLYNRAAQVVLAPLGQVRSPLQAVALPVLARVQEDQRRFEAYLTSAQLALGYLLGIPLALAAGLAEPVVAIMLGSAWADAAPLVRLFAIAGLLTTLSYVGYWVYLARGLGKELLRYTIVTAVLKIACIVVGSSFGLVGVAVAFAVHPAIAWPISLLWLSRATALPTRALFEGAVRVFVVAALAGVPAWLVGSAAASLGPLLAVGAGAAAGIVLAAAALLVPAFRRDARALSSFVRLMLRRRRADRSATGA